MTRRCTTGSTGPVLTYKTTPAAISKAVARDDGQQRPGAVQSVPAGVTAAMSFFANGTLEGNGGSNNFSGSYTVEGDSISIGPLMGTRMSCGEQTDTFEFQFLTALENSAQWSVSGGMTLRDSGGAQQVAATTAVR